jgi:hypothetical protein
VSDLSNRAKARAHHYFLNTTTHDLFQECAEAVERAEAIPTALSRGFMTACSGDGEYQIKITFETIEDMHAAHAALSLASDQRGTE